MHLNNNNSLTGTQVLQASKAVAQILHVEDFRSKVHKMQECITNDATTLGTLVEAESSSIFEASSA